MRTLCTILLFATLLSGCATMNEAECVTADWTAVGYEDGASGRDATYIGNHRSACARYGVTPDIDEYRSGYEEGIVYYCRPGNGFTVGRSGGSYNGVCPAELSGDFITAFNQGRELYQLETEIDRTSSTIEENREAIAALQEQIDDKEATLVSDDATEEVRTSLLEEIREHEQEIGRLQAEISELERDRMAMRQEYAELEARYSAY